MDHRDNGPGYTIKMVAALTISESTGYSPSRILIKIVVETLLVVLTFKASKGEILSSQRLSEYHCISVVTLH